MQEKDSTDGDFLYLSVASQLETAIQSGTLAPGERLMSIRKMATHNNVSINTILLAYQHLTDKGVIHSRPKSGYFVSEQTTHYRKHQFQSKELFPSATSALQILEDLNLASRQPEYLNLGSAVLDTKLSPINQIKQSVGSVIASSTDRAFKYGPAQGEEILINTLSQHYKQYGMYTSESEIVIFNGATDAICSSIEACTLPGEAVGVVSPCYNGLLQAVVSTGRKITELPMSGGRPCLDSLEESAAAHKIRCLILTANFQNPSGICISNADKHRILDIANRNGVKIIEDDTFGEIHFMGARPKTLFEFDSHDTVYYVSSCSKTVSPGLRVGWAFIKDEHIRELILMKKQARYVAVNTIAQLSLAYFISNGYMNAHLKRLNKTLHENMSRFESQLSSGLKKGITISKPKGGMSFWITHSKDQSSSKVFRRCLEHKIIVTPGDLFSPSSTFNNSFRLCFSNKWQSPRTEQALDTLIGIVNGI